MGVYSHSKLSTFEQCRYKYKLRYIDKIPSPIKKSIEAHLGECVHDALEWLYKNVIRGKIPEIDGLIEKYSHSWSEKDSEEILIVRDLKKQDYFEKGVKFLIDYYIKHRPFDDGTLETEKRIWVNLEENSPHKIIGYIDRLVYNKEKDQYEIHDYKTANTLPNREKFEADRQLALYSIAIKDLYGREKPVILTWHYLNYNMKITSIRTNEELEKLKKDTINLIKEIEKTTEFPPTKSILCEWCEYKPYCKAWGNSIPKEFQKEENNRVGDIFPTVSKYLKD
ncbi:MAG: PD-(D/E)XK nuclease family protein [Nanoarchaeota archaeon]|nr:PD-(D/E)XK nuclease family protein [Nanoarchaeota archaeon]